MKAKQLHFHWVQKADEYAAKKQRLEAECAEIGSIHDAQAQHDRAVQLAIMFGISALLDGRGR